MRTVEGLKTCMHAKVVFELDATPKWISPRGCARAVWKSARRRRRELGSPSAAFGEARCEDLCAQAEMIQVQGPYCSISAFDRGDDYDEYGVCIA